MSLSLVRPQATELRPRIVVFGVGGAGGNAVNNMIASGLSGVTFVVANTDAQSLANSAAEYRIQLGVNLTEGLGAGARPEIGAAAAEEAIEDIRAQIEAELGSDLCDVYKTFDEKPLATASIGQVHRAVLHDGRVVAVKVQHPGIREAMETIKGAVASSSSR